MRQGIKIIEAFFHKKIFHKKNRIFAYF